jgi:hypothetical protein
MSCRRVLLVSSLAGAPTVLLFVILSATSALAQGSARSLDIQPGARQNGLGAAGVALFGDPSDALWWNPAALGFADRTSAQYTHANLLPDLADIPYSHAAVATSLGTWGGFGTSFTHLDYGEWFGFESSPAIAIGVRAHPMVSVGASLKWVDVDLGGVTGSTFISDIGALLRVERAPWTFGVGAMYQNFGGRVDFGNFGSSPPSRNYKAGVSAAVPVRLSEDVTVGGTAVVDYNQSGVTNEFHLWNGGVEGHLTFDDVFRVEARCGYYYDPLGEIEDFTIGGGVRAWVVAFDIGRIPQARGSGLDPVVKITAGIHVDLSSGKPSWRMD